MSRIPSRHLALSHEALTQRLAASARRAFREPSLGQTWDPLTHLDASLVDLGRGLLDSVALALHVLWTYQQAWAEETFLATARLDDSVGRLLAQVGYRPGPGSAALGFQHFRCKAGTHAVLAAGSAVQSPPQGDEPPLTFETLAPLRLQPELNELKAFLPPPAPAGAGQAGGVAGAGAGVPSKQPGEPTVPAPSGGLLGTGSVVDALQHRIEVQRHGPLEERRVARARQEARKIASLMKTLGSGADEACQSMLDTLCQKLCDAQQIVAQAPPPAGRPVGALSESQEMLARQLRNLQARHQEAIAALQEALAPCEGEDAAAYSRRLDRMATFLDAFVGGLLQEARDQIVLLRGSEALNRLDRAFGAEAGTPPRLGRATPGIDGLYLMPLAGRPEGEALPPVRPGDWLVVAEDIERPGPTGRPVRERIYREAVRVFRVRVETPLGERTRMLHLTFQPPLSRAYRLDDVVLLGNVTLVSHGSTVEELGRPSADRRTIPLGQRPLTWLKDARCPGGVRPEVTLTVGGRPWRRVENLLDAGPDAPVFAVENLPGGAARLRVGDGVNGAPLPLGAEVRLRYRVGLGARGNRAALRLDAMARPHPAVESTLNPLPTTNGADSESTPLARTRGPASAGTLDRAVSVLDVESLARVSPGVLRARVFHPTAQRRLLTVVVSGPGGQALAAPELESLRTHLAARVPPGVQVRVENRQPVEVCLRLLLRLHRGVDPVAVVQRARVRLGLERALEAGATQGLLAPDNVELGEDLSLSQVYGALAGVEGLHSAVLRQLHRREEAPSLSERVVATPRELLGWAAPREGTEGVELLYEEARER